MTIYSSVAGVYVPCPTLPFMYTCASVVVGGTLCLIITRPCGFVLALCHAGKCAGCRRLHQMEELFERGWMR